MAIRVTFYGAAGEVTGSAYHVEAADGNVLVDFGMFQGGPDHDEKNRVPDRLDVGKLDAVLLTHAHLDHVGRLPLLVKHGFKGPVFCTPATIELASLILKDSAKVQASDLKRVNRRRERAGQDPAEPIYDIKDVERAIGLFRPVPYDEPVPVAKGMRARWVEAGHILGSASIQLCIEQGGGTKTLVFSGDLGPKGAPLLKDAVGFHTADLVVMESTYGDRDHKPFEQTVDEFEAIVKAVVARKGKILIPTFAVGRTQLLLYLLAQMFRENVVPKFPAFVDSPMAIEATRIHLKHLELFDDDFQRLQRQRPLQDDLDSVKPTPTADDSKALNGIPGPCLIMAGAGMCNAGRILHHLKQNLWREGTSVIIVGFQGQGTLGRLLVDGARRVRIFGEKIAVRATIHPLGGFSAHAGQTDLLDWFAQLGEKRPQVILTHGEAKGREPLAKLIEQRWSLKPRLPALGDMIEV